MRVWLLLLAMPFAGCSARPVAVNPEAGAQTLDYGAPGARGFLCRPGGDGPFPALLLIHGDKGLTDWEKTQAKRLADKGYIVLAVDLYRGEVVSGVLDAHIMERGLADDQVQANLKSAVDFLLARSDVRPTALGVIGWDMGGGYALDAGIRDQRLKAVVVCYGRLTTDAQLLAPMQASVLGIFAGKNEGIPPETIASFQAAMQKASKRAIVHTYPSASHGFMNPSEGQPDESASAHAWSKIDSFLATELKR